ncbi:MAG: mechanosensitive ion channel domain-containing protein [Bacteroidota bacterium]
MEQLLNNIQYSWTYFFLLAGILLISYFGLRFLRKILDNTNVFGRYQRLARNLTYGLMLIYEPAVLLVLGTVFLLVDPVLHGLLLLLVLLSGFSYIKNYVSGRIVQFDYAISVGNRLGTAQLEGIIAEMGRLGLRIRNSEGLHYINYSELLSKGYSLLSADQFGGFYRLRIQSSSSEDKTDPKIRLMDLLATTPYLDWNHRPELRGLPGQEETFSVKVLVKEESHLSDLIYLIREWGFDCTTFENTNKQPHGNSDLL